MNASGKRTIALIPARGGSKGLPGKNVRPIGGKPLIAHSVEHAIQSGVCDRVLVTTDSPEIKAAAEAAGAWCPFLRETGLAEDLTPTEPVLTDALEKAEAIDGPFDIVVFLQPTDIFRKPEWIDNVSRMPPSTRGPTYPSVPVRCSSNRSE
jgi:CMP-N-acetylneuraminic acid synthetase